MSGVILQTEAIKVINKGGGVKQSIGRPDGRGPKMIKAEKVTGSDYVIFNCPHCNHRNNRSIYDADYAHQGILAFKCKICRGDIEVSRLKADLKRDYDRPLIVSPEQYEMEKKQNAGSGNNPILHS